jgi:L-amino acid N-acyltransferase YncA
VVELRRATGADWPAIWPIWHRIVAAGETYTYAPTTPEPEARRLWMAPHPAEVWVAEDAGTVVGTALLRPSQPGLGDHVANAGFMVDPARSGEGIGRRLAEAILARAVDAGYAAMQFNAVVATNRGAMALWRSLGFAEVGRIPGGFRHPRHGAVDLVVMHRVL